MKKSLSDIPIQNYQKQALQSLGIHFTEKTSFEDARSMIYHGQLEKHKNSTGWGTMDSSDDEDDYEH